MLHRVKGKKLNRHKDSRKALKLVMIKDFFVNEKLETTLVKAKYIRPVIEKIITKAKDNSLANRRLLLSRLGNNKIITEKLIDDIGVRFKDRKGGYTRIHRTTIRSGDNTELAVIELTEKKTVDLKKDKKSVKAGKGKEDKKANKTEKKIVNKK